MSAIRPAFADAGTAAPAPAAVLKIDGLDLLFRQSDIRTLESASDVDCGDYGGKCAGRIGYGGQRWPVYCLSEQLELLDSVPASRRTCALLALEAGYFGVLCDDASIARQLAGRRHEVPVAMRTPGTPIVGLLPDNGRLLSIASPARLAAHIDRLVRRSSPDKEPQCRA